ncbi:MAG: BamA/TamA family outer membrane protein, partial [Spirochaetia bacterium]|nr:BamA/TamA family outer membrane protein [Spirochaetia bacterium]
QSSRQIMKTLDFKTGVETSKKGFFQAIDKLYSGNNYNYIRYDFQEHEEGYIIHLNVNEKTAQRLNISFNYNTDENTSLLLYTSIKNIILRDSKIEMSAKLNSNHDYIFRFSKQLPFLTKLETGAEAQSKKMLWKVRENGNNMMEVSVVYNTLDLFLDYNFSNSILIGASLGKELVVYDDEISLISINEKYEYYKNSYYITFDFLDSEVYPTKGILFNISADEYFTLDFTSNIYPESESNDNFIIFSANADAYIPLTDYLSFQLYTLAGLTNLFTQVPGEGFSLGGNISNMDIYMTALSGYERAEYYTDNLFNNKIALHFYFKDGFFIIPFYEHCFFDIKSIENIYKNSQKAGSYGLSIKKKTPIGPVSLKYAKGNKKDSSVISFNLGYSF